MAKFYDPLTERWYTMPERPEPPRRTRFEILVDKLAERRATQKADHDTKIWDAVTATATASQMSTETESVEMDQDRP